MEWPRFLQPGMSFWTLKIYSGRNARSHFGWRVLFPLLELPAQKLLCLFWNCFARTLHRLRPPLKPDFRVLCMRGGLGNKVLSINWPQIPQITKNYFAVDFPWWPCWHVSSGPELAYQLVWSHWAPECAQVLIQCHVNAQIVLKEIQHPASTIDQTRAPDKDGFELLSHLEKWLALHLGLGSEHGFGPLVRVYRQLTFFKI